MVDMMKIELEFRRMNPYRTTLLWRADGKLEWMCEHGVGHTVWHPEGFDFMHGCDGCCKDVKVLKKYDVSEMQEDDVEHSDGK